MSEKQDIHWTRLLVEDAAVVASILLAFSIEAWRELGLVAEEANNIVDLIDRELADARLGNTTNTKLTHVLGAVH